MRKHDGVRFVSAMTVLGALLLLGSLFLAWSHQITPSLRRAFPGGLALEGVPAAPTAWQVYSAMDVVLALLAVGVGFVAVAGDRRARIVAGLAVCVGLAFVAHAVVVPPTSGLLLVAPGSAASNPASARYVALHPGAGVGETVALAGLVLALLGLAVSALAEGSGARMLPGIRATSGIESAPDPRLP